jgi:hypothetical protein
MRGWLSSHLWIAFVLLGAATHATAQQPAPTPPSTNPAHQAQFNLIRQILEQSPVGPYMQFGAGGTFWDDIQVGNGNFNTDLNATGPKFDATLSVPIPGGLVPNSTFEARFYGFRGSGSQDLSGNAGIFNQANGGVQVINLPITSGETRVEMTQVGGEARLKFKVLDAAPPTPAQRVFFSYTPFVGAGFERATLDTQTLIDIVPFNFRTSDARTTVTDTVFISGGLQVDSPPVFPGGPVIFVFGSGRINFDSVTGMTVYDTQGIGFHEILHNQFSRNVVTFGGEAGIGVLQQLPNNSAFLRFVASVASQPLHEIVFHPGQPATLEDSQHLRAELAAMLVVPFIPFTPLTP